MSNVRESVDKVLIVISKVYKGLDLLDGGKHWLFFAYSDLLWLKDNLALTGNVV
jgi:hypothetical protein